MALDNSVRDKFLLGGILEYSICVTLHTKLLEFLQKLHIWKSAKSPKKREFYMTRNRSELPDSNHKKRMFKNL
ncbi:hypothetical protein LEP1GSC008_1644 [Leptospira kirschneri serovar Bulgarica str. Nikolaevo]|uniref:Uncharacterized protein n=2 Tax=Leptospira kirschneri TaxID=29507 RepID=A0A0E2AZC5_9LEPT|nr:hypothetical protein LEP1GSC081_3026 [Leptospira kirschneri str. H1]EMK26276.1 hypothetical protein LEP1GSC008_1644 [Leptospira kirschneri serovar Bulgarica str. Nikolaevo]